MCVYIPLHNALQGEVAKAVCQAFLPELYILLTGRTGEQHGGMGLLPPSPWVCPTHWESDAGVGIKRKETQTQKNKNARFLEIVYEEFNKGGLVRKGRKRNSNLSPHL